MHRTALVLSLSCLTFAAMNGCGNSSNPGGPLPGVGNAPGAGGAGSAGVSGVSGGSGAAQGGSGGTISAGAGGAATGGGGAGGTDPTAGSGGSVAGSGGATAGAGGAGGDGATGHLPPTKDPRGIYGHPDPNTTYPQYPGFGAQPFLVEEFNSAIDLNRDPFWTWGDGALDDGKSRMVEQNITFDSGHMVLSLTGDPQQGGYSFSAADFSPNSVASGAEFRSIYNDFRYGRYEVRMKSPPGGTNNFLHTMFAYRTPAFLGWREVDIELTASPQNNFISNVIIGPPGTRKWMETIAEATTDYPTGGDGAAALLPGFNTSADFHTYAFEWLPEQIKWFVDGNLVRVKKDGVGNHNLPVPKDSTKIMMNVWVFGNTGLGGGDPALNQYPIHGEYDWFRFYKADVDTTYPCVNTPSCLPSDDLRFAKNNWKDPLPDVRPEFCTSASGKLDTSCGP